MEQTVKVLRIQHLENVLKTCSESRFVTPPNSVLLYIVPLIIDDYLYILLLLDVGLLL